MPFSTIFQLYCGGFYAKKHRIRLVTSPVVTDNCFKYIFTMKVVFFNNLLSIL